MLEGAKSMGIFIIIEKEYRKREKTKRLRLNEEYLGNLRDSLETVEEIFPQRMRYYHVEVNQKENCSERKTK